MHCITNPQATVCKTAVSGKNILKINDTQSNNLAWNLFDYAENETDTLPKLGDRAGGSFLLFVPVGRIVEGIFFASTTTLTRDLSSSDETDAKIVIQNSKSDTDIKVKAFVATYDGKKLAGIGANDITISKRGQSGVSVSECEVKGINVKEIDKNSLKVKAFLFENMVPLATVSNLYYKTKKISPDNQNIKYIGRWRNINDRYLS